MLAVVHQAVGVEHDPTFDALESVIAIAPDLSTTKPPAKRARTAVCAARSLPPKARLVTVAHSADLWVESGIVAAVPATT